ncbi:MAG: DUF2357 domain-containing protein [Bacillus sp. (in: firmicutes)]
MVTPTKSIMTAGGQALPFSLSLVVGAEGHSQYRVLIQSLEENPYRIMESLVEIEEQKDLVIEFEGASGICIEVLWDSGNDHAADQEERIFTLSSQEPYKVLFMNSSDMNQQEEGYRWSCGIYHFQVLYGQTLYHGAFKVNPKNLDNKQYEKMHQMINEHVSGLGYDYLHARSSISCINSRLLKVKVFCGWYGGIEKDLLGYLREIQTSSMYSLGKTYAVEDHPGHLDSRSIRWENGQKGAFFKGTKYLNRKFGPDHDVEENRLVKYRIHRFLAVLKEMRALASSSSGSPISSPNAAKLEEQLSRFQRNLQLIYHTGFWRDIRLTSPQKVYVKRQTSYQRCHELWMEGARIWKRAHDQRVLAPIYKPTAVLYEYYVFFGLLQILEEMGFSTGEETLSQQLESSFFEAGLKPGTTITLYMHGQKIKVIYDQEICYGAEEALETGSHFYSFRPKRRPDIRVDLYERNGGIWRYHSSVILEIKYSPLSNIYRPYKMTTAMEQMEDYRSFKYAYGRDDYHYAPIRDVFCIYPGNDIKPVLYSSPAGIYVQVAPVKGGTDPAGFHGKQELKKLLSAWLL